jgi:CheY-like chemotaxis protein
MIRRNVTLEARLIDDLLDLARIGRGTLALQREIADAHQLVNHVIEICRDDLERARLEFTLDLSATRHHVDADPIRFQQVLWNLIKNAIKFTPAGGTVTVRSRSQTAAANGPATIPGTSVGPPLLFIEVIDTGIGIEPALLPRVFDTLEQGGVPATRQFGGLGLGLTISRSILHQHGGRIWATSAGPGQGATFTVEMPSIAPPVVSRPRQETPTPTSVAFAGLADHRPPRILLVDDNVDTLKSLTRLLTLRGLEVVPADSQTTALALAAQAEFDVLVSDIELPDGNGVELMARLRDARPLAGIALSGFGAPEDIKHSLAAGFALHLVKPVDFRRLEQAIREVAASASAESAVEG